MKTFCLSVVFLFWMIFTLILTCSVIGWVLLLPKINYTSYDISQERLRSTWMRIGHDLKDKLTNL